MTIPSPSFEATLLLDFQPAIDPVRLAEDLANVAEGHDLTAMPVPTKEPSLWRFALGDLRIHIFAGEQSLVPQRFLDAFRPAETAMTEVEILSCLTSHRHSLTVLVCHDPVGRDLDTECLSVDEVPQNRERQALMERICWQVTECLRAMYGAGLIFWTANNTLYATAEFDRADLFGADTCANPRPLPTQKKRCPADVQRDIEARALTYIYGQIVQGAHRPKRQLSGLNQMIQNGTAGFLLKEKQVRRATATMCSTASIGLGALQIATGALPGF